MSIRRSLRISSSLPTQNHAGPILRKRKFVFNIDDTPQQASSKSITVLSSKTQQRQTIKPIPNRSSTPRKRPLRVPPETITQSSSAAGNVDLRKTVRRRSTYSHAEDLAILKYLMENNLVEKANLHSTWRQLEAAKVTQHTAESMRNRVKRSIANDLPLLLPDVNVKDLTTLRAFLLKNSPPIQLSSVDLIPATQSDDIPNGFTSNNCSNSDILTDDTYPFILQPSVTPTNPPIMNFSPIRGFPSSDLDNSALADAAQPAPSTSTQRPPNPFKKLFCEGIDQTQKKPSDGETSTMSDLLSTSNPYWFPIIKTPSSVSPPPDVTSIVSSTLAVIDFVDEFCRRWSSMSLTRNEALILLHCCSGSLETADRVLLDPFQPVWLPADDAILTSAQTHVSELEALIEKFGREVTFNRLAYLSNRSSLFLRTECGTI